MSDFEIVSKNAKVDTCYGLETFHITKEEIAALLSGKKLYSTINCGEYAITIQSLEEPKTGHCRDCKHWKDSDGVYRRGIGAESWCPINCKKVYEGDGYCFMFEPQESEDE